MERTLKAVLFVLVASTGEKLVARRTGRGATSTRLSSVALKLMSERVRDERRKISTGSRQPLHEQWREWVRGGTRHVARCWEFPGLTVSGFAVFSFYLAPPFPDLLFIVFLDG